MPEYMFDYKQKGDKLVIVIDSAGYSDSDIARLLADINTIITINTVLAKTDKLLHD